MVYQSHPFHARALTFLDVLKGSGPRYAIIIYRKSGLRVDHGKGLVSIVIVIVGAGVPTPTIVLICPSPLFQSPAARPLITYVLSLSSSSCRIKTGLTYRYTFLHPMSVSNSLLRWCRSDFRHSSFIHVLPHDGSNHFAEYRTCTARSHILIFVVIFVVVINIDGHAKHSNWCCEKTAGLVE